jgi:hypothetical protein
MQHEPQLRRSVFTLSAAAAAHVMRTRVHGVKFTKQQLLLISQLGLHASHSLSAPVSPDAKLPPIILHQCVTQIIITEVFEFLRTFLITKLAEDLKFSRKSHNCV